jgi:stearoyl-CoA desaturase (Delta-9 desaturase)
MNLGTVWLFVPVLLVSFLLTQVAVVSTSIYLHRGLTHRSLTIHPVADVIFRLVLWLTTGQRREQWVAVHRKHHAFTDAAGDPHSPKLLGFWRVQLGNVFYYMREAKNAATIRIYAPDIKQDRWDRVLFEHTMLGPAIGIGLLVAMFGWPQGLAIALSHMVSYVFVVAPLINGLGHWAGVQNFKNGAFNWKSFAWFTGGESLHNNHHAHPQAPKFSMGRREADPSWPVILMLRGLGLVKIRGRMAAPVPRSMSPEYHQ